MSAGHHLNMPLALWEGVVTLLTALGLGGVLTALVNRPSRRADATVSKEHATGEAAVITATASAIAGRPSIPGSKRASPATLAGGL